MPISMIANTVGTPTAAMGVITQSATACDHDRVELWFNARAIVARSPPQHLTGFAMCLSGLASPTK